MWEGLRDVKGLHTKGARGYGTTGVEGWPGVLHHVGYREEGRPRRGGRWEEWPHTGRGTLLMVSPRGRGARGFSRLGRVWVSRHCERECSDDLRAEADGRVGSAEGRDLTLLIGMTQRPRWGPCRRHGATKAGRKLPQRKWDLRGLEKGSGGGLGLGRKAPPPPSARPQRAPPRPGALRAAAWAVGERSQGNTIRTREGGLGGEGGARGQSPVGGGGGRHTLGKRLGHIQNGPINEQSQGGVKGQLCPMGRENTSEVRRKKRKKKCPTEQQWNPFGGLEGWKWASFINVLAPAFPFEGWGH